MNEQAQNPLGYADPKKLLVKFTIPSIISMTSTNLYNLADQVFIGWKVGMLGNAATNIAFPLTTISLSLSLLIGIGFGSRYGIELGKNNKKTAEKTIGNALLLMVIFGIALAVITEIFLFPMMHAFGATDSVLPYSMTYVRITAIGFPFFIFANTACILIRMDGSPKYSMFCTVIGCAINVILDPVLMFSMDMGIEGAAIATVLSQIAGFIACLPYFFKMKQIRLTRQAFLPDIKNIIQNMSLGLCNCISQISITLIQIVINNALIYYGALSVYGPEIPLSAAGIIMKINSIVTGLFVAISQGGQPLYSFNYGAGQYERVKSVYRHAIKMSLMISVAAFLIFELFPRQLLSMFGENSDLFFEFGVAFMRIFLCMTIVNGIQIITTNFFSAVAMPWKGTILAVFRNIILLIPLVVILPKFVGIYGIPFSGPISDLTAAVVSILVLRYAFRRMVK